MNGSGRQSATIVLDAEDDRVLDLLAEKLAARLLPVLTTPARRRGGEPAWRTAARQRRDAALRELAASEAGGLRISEIADRVIAKARRYEMTAWPRDRRRGAPDRANVALFDLLNAGLPLPGPKTAKAILLARPV